MKYNVLSSSGCQVSQYVLGTMMMGAMGNKDHSECIKMIHMSLEAGVNLIDTAHFYSAGESELIVGKALQGRRRDALVSTKFSLNSVAKGHVFENISEQVNACLKRLNTDYIDVYSLARYDYSVPPEEILMALDVLKRQGKIRSYGASMLSADQIVETQYIAKELGVSPFEIEQPNYSIFSRGIESNILPVADRFNVGVMVWSPLEGSWLTGRYLDKSDLQGENRIAASAKHHKKELDVESLATVTKLDRAQILNEIAKESGLTLRHMAMAFALEHPAITSAVIGPRTLNQLSDLIECADLRLTSDVLDKIDEIIPPGTNLSGFNPTAIPEGLRDTASRRRKAL